MLVKDEIIGAVDDDRVFFAQSNQFLVVAKDRRFIGEVLLNVDVRIVRIYPDPGCSGRKASMLTGICLLYTSDAADE